MSLEITGRLHKKYDAVDVSPKFKKREFVVELSEEISGNTYINYAAMQLVNNKCGIIDQFNEGDMVKVNFNIRGSKWTKDGKERYFSNLDAWRVERFDGAAAGNSQQYAQPAQNNYGGQPAQNNYSGAGQYNSNSSTEANDDLPF
jgi:hypothetical protein